MRMSNLIGRRFKEKPVEATLKSHEYLLRGGYARQVANGIYSLLPAGFRVTHKIENIIREEMDRIGGQEVLMPVVLPRELWDESDRFESVGPELLRFVDRTGHAMLLAMTHEEAVVHLTRYEATSYRQYPFMVYQIQTKFRDEPRSRGGLIRVREFTMKDAYSFHCSMEDLERYYAVCAIAYHRIFCRAGIPETAVVQSDSGIMGGKVAHEFMLLCDSGEDTIVKCPQCGYIANTEVAEGRIESFPEKPLELEKVHTPGMKTIDEVADFLGMQPRQTAKVVFYESDSEGKPVMAIIRGDVEINEAKLAKIIKVAPALAEEETILKSGAVPGFASPMGVKNCRIIVDPTVRDSNNLVTGANEVDYHVKNFNVNRDCPSGAEVADIARIREGDGCSQCEGKLVIVRGIEVGNIFQLGTKYSETMGMRYLDENGKEQVPIMGCYGIGVGRLMSSVMEAHYDKWGPIWPITIAPWQVHICALQFKNESIRETAEMLYNELKEAGIEVILDDRDERPGVQFADADLLGVPFRFIISERNIKESKLEWKIRGTDKSGTILVSEAVDRARDLIQSATDEINQRADSITEPF